MSNTRRTIEEAFDIQSGVEFTADDFFRQPFDVLTQARSEQERANQQKRGKWLVCATCGANLRILGGKSDTEFRKPGKNFHFAHLHNSEDCPIKTTSKYSREDINRMRYRGIAEGQPHIELKAKLYQGLNLNAIHKGQVTNLQLEKVIRSLDEGEWRKPDINLHFKGRRLAVELQLSTTWLDVIVGRQEFYRQEKIFILWVFNAFDRQDNSRKLAYSDIIYTNNYNAFIFDEEAREATLQQKDLVLKCYFQHHYADEDRVQSKWQHELVTLEQLTYNHKNFKVYYKDIEAEKAEAALAAKQYHQKQAKEKDERRRERNHMRAVRADISSEHTQQQKAVRRIAEEIVQVEKLIRRNIQECDSYDNGLSSLPSEVSSIAERLDTYWRGLPDPVEELADVFSKRRKQLNAELKKLKELITNCERDDHYYGHARVKHVGGTEYHVLDRNKEWDFISKNASRLYAYRTDQEKNLFATVDIQPLNNHKIMQMRYSAQVEFLINFKEEIAANSQQKITLDKDMAALTVKNNAFNEYIPHALKNCLQNHYTAQRNQISKALQPLQQELDKLRLEKAKQQAVADELFGKYVNMDYLDYYEEEDRNY